MKIVTASNGKKKIKISKSEWETIGKKNGWMKKAQFEQMPPNAISNATEALNNFNQQNAQQTQQPSQNGQQEQWRQSPQYIKSVTDSAVKYLNDIANNLGSTFTMNKVPLTQEAISAIQGAVQNIVQKASQLQPTQQ